MAQQARLSQRRQVTIPREVVERLELTAGQPLDVIVTGDAIVLLPQDRIPDDQRWFWTDEWQAREREADEAIACGDVVGPFDTADKAIEALRTAKL